MERVTQNLISGQPWTFGGSLERDIHCILVEKAKESTEKSKLLKKIVMKSLLLRKITRERIKRDMLKIK